MKHTNKISSDSSTEPGRQVRPPRASEMEKRTERNARRRELYFEQKTMRNEIGVQPMHVLAALEARPPGLYEVGALMKGYWKRIPKRGRSRYGYLLHGLVTAGFFPRLRWLGQRSNGHHVYELHAEERRPAREQRQRGEFSTARANAGGPPWR